MIRVGNVDVQVSGKFMTIGNIRDDVWLPSSPVENMKEFISIMLKSQRRPDIFTFRQNLPNTTPMYDYHMEWDNVAAIPITTYDEWWTKRLPQVTRKNVRRGYKRGVTVEATEFSDDLVMGIMNIYNETPIRQGRLFWHYQKDFDTVKKGNSSYLENSDFICAYFENELIGFIKVTYVGPIAQIMQIISLNRHQDKRTTNLLIAKAVEMCIEKKKDYFVYGKYVYGNKTKSPLIDFKQRNGFEMFRLPRYYIPLTRSGRLCLRFGLHKGIGQLIPEKIAYLYLDARAKWYAIRYNEGRAGD